MKLTKKLEAEIKALMIDYWASYLNGNIRHWKKYLVDDYRNIGGTEEEIWNSKKEILDYTNRMIDQMKGLTELRNKQTQIIPYDPYFMVHELLDVYIKVDEQWTFYQKFRLSSLIQKIDSQWKVLHQHGSYPDSKTQEGEAFAVDEIKMENRKLKDAIKRRTIQLEIKNRELEIETSLEKVRAVAMGMHKPDDMLGVCKILFQELQSLGFDKLRNTLINSFPKGTAYFVNYDYSLKTGGQVAQIPVKGNTSIEKFVKTIRKSANAFHHLVVKGKELKDWIAFRKANKEPNDPRLNKIESLHYYNYSVGNSGIGISTYSPITKEKQQLLQRFRNVFQLAYQRYTDITLAEAQVREAQIETALERVRSRSLAMHNTSELQDVIHTVHKELLNLNIAINGGSFIAINSDIESTLRCWGSGGTADTTEEIRIPLYKKPFCTNLINRIKKGPGFFTEAYTQKEKKDFFTFLFKHDPWKKLYAKQKKETLSSPGGYTRSCLVSKHTSIFIINHLGEIFSTADNDILQRFGKVFEQSYTRFLDLQKAEAQAREAQIELGLERVRARAMAMQNSDELKELIGTVFTELTKLDLALTRCIIWVFEPATNAASWWMANSEDPSNPMSFYIKYHKHPAYLTFVNEWKKQNVKFVYDLKGRDKIAWDNILFNETELKQLPAAVKNGMKAPVRVLLSASFNNFGGINVASLNPLSEEHFDILLRFAKVFDLTYTRFNDLQKAEAQAKEARIETALERVRAVAMAMKKSDEVINVCEVMYKELQSLGFTNIRNAQIALKNDSRQSYSISVYSDNESVIFGEAHYLSSPIVKDLYRELEQSKDAFYQREFSGKKFNDWRKWREGLSPFADSREASATSMCFYLYSIGIGHIGISTFNAITEIQIEMLKRFKNVFELCYTRYIDVAKAEVQAREAQIELGLERVRARAMAMQHSDELSQLVDTVFKELANLDFALNWCIINIIDEPSLTNMVWAANPETNKPPESYLMKFEDYPFHHSMMKGYQERKAKHVYVLEGKEKKDYDEYLFNKTEWRRVPKKAQAASRAMKRYVASFTFSNFGGLQTVGEEPLSEESLDILSRFGKVFDLTYTRFNDLQKAEAQAREAEIELALERVRARTMAMQKSDELAEAASILFQQLQQLGIHCYSSGFTIWDEDHDELISWMCNADGSMNPPFKLPLTDTSWHKEQYQSWKNKEEFAVKDFTGKAMQNHFQYLRSFPLLDEAFKKSIAAGHPMPKRQVHQVANFSFGNLLFITLEPCSESHEIFKRFAKVFDQTYTRFLDLQKAEASAREAEIELALERVRARTMAMQHSEELLEVATVLFQQVKGLGVPQWNCGFNIWEPGDKAFTYYPGTPDGVISPSPCKIPLHEHPVFRRFDESRKKGVELLVYEKEGKEQKDHYQYMLSLPGVGDLLQSMLDAGFELPAFQIDHLANFAYGNLIFITYEHFPEMHQVFKRFARVFEQTYTRFLDLQKAEAQARDAKINLAVERVRARALAMFKSDEILEVVFKLKEEIMSLEIPGVAAATIHLKEKNGLYRMWDLSSLEQDGKSMHLPLDIIYLLEETDPSLYIRKVWENTEKYFLVMQNRKDLKITTNWLRENNKKKEADEADQFLDSVEFSFLYHPTIQLNNGRMSIDLLDNPPPDEMESILVKMGGAFDLAYKRFEDLKKSEEQLRESKVDLALERVRSQAMAMQKSSDLLDIVVTMRNEFTRLGHEAHYFWHMMWLPEKYEKAMTSGDGTKIGFVMELPRHIHGDIPLLDRWEKSEEPTAVYAMNVEEALDYVHKMVSLGDFKNIDPQAPSNDDIRHIGGLTFIMARTTHGEIGFNLPGVVENPPKEDIDILIRFAGAFDIAHRRFLDLQKSEAQARGVEIELALEKVRSRSMGMQKSEELKEVIQVVYDEFVKLNINVEHTGFIIDYKTNDDMHIWLADRHKVPAEISIPYFDSPHWNSFVDAKANACLPDRQGEYFFANLLSFEEKNKFYTVLFEVIPGLPEEIKEYYLSCEALAISTVLIDNVGLYIENFTGTVYTDEENKILMRFGKVFQQTYTRFLDLQKAEASTREAKIEAALEKVRSRSLAMHNADELGEVITVVFEKLNELDFTVKDGVALITFTEGSKDLIEWMTNPGFDAAMNIHLPYFDHPILSNLWKAKDEGKEFFVKRYDADENKSFLNHIFEYTEFHHTPQDIKDFCLAADSYATSIAFQKNTAIFINDYSGLSLSGKEITILNRFAKVFEQTYIRFLDLQKAEAQAREAKIEMALEKVRASAMAMHHSHELDELLTVLFDQFDVLGIQPITTHMTLIDMENNTFTFRETGKGGRRSFGEQRVAIDSMDIWTDAANKWRNSEPLAINSLHFPPESLPMLWQIFHESFAAMPEDAKITPEDYPNGIYHTAGKLPFGYIGMNQVRKPTQEEEQIVVRFASEFGRAYTRFLDLQKAEAQAREAKIEMALEKIRSRTMAMQHSDELPEAANLLFLEVQALGIPAWSAGYNILADDKKSCTCIMSSEGLLQQPFTLHLTGEASFIEMHEFLKGEEQFLVQELGGMELKQHYNYMKSFPELKDTFQHVVDSGLSLPTYQINHLVKYNNGFLLFITYEKVPEAHDIFKRFTKVFEQTYTRFLDLKKAEAQAREAQIEAGLEKVRSRTLAMQKSDELADTSIVIFEQLINLGIEPNRLFIGIINDKTQNIEAWATNEDGTRIGDHFTLNTDRNESVKKMYEGWKHKKTSITIDMQGTELQNYFHYLADEMKIPFKGGLSQKRRVQTIAYFGQGLIGMASPDEQPQATTQLLERFAAVFNLTYTRFNDLKIAEAHAIQAEEDLIKLQTEKSRAEDALTNLQATQKQLVQSEKMASLGELTAGIAHEIQNPLNFVNNFSEVSKELLDEIKEEIGKGNMEDAMEIMNDVIQNLEKINHHGKRADGIVKGMLQHSRSSSGTKEPTDINALADEYLRLAYHGLRAKDKSFNATMKTDFDDSLEKVNVVPQDLGRVILNLITNAFYVVNEKKQSPLTPEGGTEVYEPTVSVTTKKINNKVEISVKDNGKGIPKNVLDKIFQPFFTTKPTGQGTGLGLSLAFDIVTKGHGGELKVETKEGEGTTFIIQIPN